MASENEVALYLTPTKFQHHLLTPNKRECEHVVVLGSIIRVASPINSPERNFSATSYYFLVEYLR